MPCSFSSSSLKKAVPIVLAVATCALAASSLSEPFWTKTKNSTIPYDGTIESSAGLLAICRNLKPNHGSVGVYGECYAYHSGGDKNVWRTDGGDPEAMTFSGSVCDQYREGSEFFEAVDYFDTSKDNLFSFLDKTCGTYGNVTLATVAISIGIAALMALMLIVGVTCCKQKHSVLNLVSMGFGVLGFVVSIVAFAMWIAQANPLNGSFGKSFVFMVLATILFAVNSLVIYGNIRSAKLEDKPNQELHEHLPTSTTNLA